MKEYLLNWLKEHKELIGLFRFDTEQPGNLGSNRQLYNTLKNELNIEIERKEFFGLVKLYNEKGNIDEAFCIICNKLCKCKSDYSFFNTCCKDCGRKAGAITNSKNYMNKTVDEKEAIKAKRRETNLKKYGATTNLQSKDTIEKRIERYGANTPFASKETRDKIIKSNKEKHNGLANSYQWEETKNKIKQTKFDRYGDAEYRNREKIEETCLAKYGTKSYMGTTEFKEKAKEACLNQYGVDHFMKVPEIVNKLKEKNQAKYGRDWYMGSDRFKEQAKEWCLNTYGVEYNCQRKDIRDKSKAKSKLNTQWKEYLELEEEEFSIKNYSYDFKKDNILIEINPTITHNSTMSIFKDDKPKDCLYHQNKSKLAKENGYRCIHVWDWDEPLKIKLLLSNKTKIYARSCKIKEITKEECNIFLNSYHIQNTCRGQDIRLGLYYEDELVELITFGKPRYNKAYEYELLRLCTKPENIIIGGTERLFKYFIEKYSPSSIISYCDMSKFSGEVYLRLGFTLEKEGKPSKHWYNIKTKQHFTDNLLRQQGADRLIGTSLGKGTNNEQIMVENKFLEVWDCGQNTYIWHK